MMRAPYSGVSRSIVACCNGGVRGGRLGERARFVALDTVTRRLPPARRLARGMSCPLGAAVRSVRWTRRTSRPGGAPHLRPAPPARHGAGAPPPSPAASASGPPSPSDRHTRRAPSVTLGVVGRRLPPARRHARGVSCPLGEQDTASAVAVGSAADPARTGQPCAAASASARSRMRCASMSTSWRWISARRSACSCGSARCNCPSSEALRASRSRSTSATTMLRA